MSITLTNRKTSSLFVFEESTKQNVELKSARVEIEEEYSKPYLWRMLSRYTH